MPARLMDQDEVYEKLWRTGKGKMTTVEVANYLKIPYATARRYLLDLVNAERIKEESGRYNNKYYVFSDRPAIGNLPAIPHWNMDQPPVDIVTILRSLARRPPNEQQTVKFVKRIGYLISQMTLLAADWREGKPVEMKVIDGVRNEVAVARARMQWLSRLLDEMYYNEALWDPYRARKIWFDEGEVQFSVEEARAIGETVTQLLMLDGNSNL